MSKKICPLMSQQGPDYMYCQESDCQFWTCMGGAYSDSPNWNCAYVLNALKNRDGEIPDQKTNGGTVAGSVA